MESAARKYSNDSKAKACRKHSGGLFWGERKRLHKNFNSAALKVRRETRSVESAPEKAKRENEVRQVQRRKRSVEGAALKARCGEDSAESAARIA